MYCSYMRSFMKPAAKIAMACYMLLACSSVFASNQEDFATKVLEALKKTAIEHKMKDPKWDSDGLFVKKIDNVEGEAQAQAQAGTGISYQTTEYYSSKMSTVATRMANIAYDGEGEFGFKSEVESFLRFLGTGGMDGHEGKLPVEAFLALLCYKSFVEKGMMVECVTQYGNKDVQQKILDSQLRFLPLLGADKILEELLACEEREAFLLKFCLGKEITGNVRGLGEAFVSAKTMNIDKFKMLGEIFKGIESKLNAGSEEYLWWKIDFPASREEVLGAFDTFLREGEEDISMFFEFSKGKERDTILPASNEEIDKLSKELSGLLERIIEEEGGSIKSLYDDFVLIGSCTLDRKSKTLFRMFSLGSWCYNQYKLGKETDSVRSAFDIFYPINDLWSICTGADTQTPLFKVSEDQIVSCARSHLDSMKGEVCRLKKQIQVGDVTEKK